MEQRIAPLTPAQFSVFQGILRGETSRQTAERLRLSIFTVRNHTSALFARLDVHSRLELVLKSPLTRKPPAAVQKTLKRLSPTQLDVFDELLAGEDPPTIAERLNAAPDTINDHFQKILREFEVRSQLKLMAVFVVRPTLTKADLVKRRRRRAHA